VWRKYVLFGNIGVVVKSSEYIVFKVFMNSNTILYFSSSVWFHRLKIGLILRSVRLWPITLCMLRHIFFRAWYWIYGYLIAVTGQVGGLMWGKGCIGGVRLGMRSGLGCKGLNGVSSLVPGFDSCESWSLQDVGPRLRSGYGFSWGQDYIGRSLCSLGCFVRVSH